MSSFISTRLFCYSFFDRQLILRGFDLRQGREFLSLQDIKISELDLEDGAPVDSTVMGEQIVAQLRQANRTEAYVVDQNRQLLGTVNILEALAQPQSTAEALLGAEQHRLHLEDDLQQALGVARNFVGEAIPVVDATGVYVGCISEGAILGGTLDRQEQVKGRERN